MIYLDASAIDTWLLCREAYRQKYIENIVPDYPSIHLAFGSAVHKAVEYWHKGWEDTKCMYFAAQCMEELDENKLIPPDQKKWQELGMALPECIARYCDGVEPRQDAEIEQEWIIEYSGIYLCGKIDRYADGILYDVKTASEIGRTWKSDYNETLLRTFQFGLYDWYVRQIDDAPKGFKVECIIKPYRWNGAGFDKPSRLEVFDLPEIALYRERFDQQLAWHVSEIKRYHENYLEQKPWPQAGSQTCVGKFSACDYLPGCNRGWTPKVLEKYKQREEHLVVIQEAKAHDGSQMSIDMSETIQIGNIHKDEN